MSFNKVFSSKQPVLIMICIFIVCGAIALFTKIETNKIVQETIDNEIVMQKQLTILLSQLKNKLASDEEDDIKIKDSFVIIADIRKILDDEYNDLGENTKKNIENIREKLQEIERALLEDTDSALELVNKLIEDLVKEKGFEGLGKSDGEDQDPNSDYPENWSDNNNPSDSNIPSNTGENNDNSTISSDQNKDNDTDSFFKFIIYKIGKKPKVDRDQSTEIEGQTIPFKTKVGN